MHEIYRKAKVEAGYMASVLLHMLLGRSPRETISVMVELRRGTYRRADDTLDPKEPPGAGDSVSSISWACTPSTFAAETTVAACAGMADCNVDAKAITAVKHHQLPRLQRPTSQSSEPAHSEPLTFPENRADLRGERVEWLTVTAGPHDKPPTSVSAGRGLIDHVVAGEGFDLRSFRMD